ncbi:aminopeptidase N-like [Amphiura filiformis]|uniref:aminopeptidase N-like n=1 Tax=Amphiura filiformis TaxID=82378 RepID=UPI003B228D0A
MSEDYNDSPKVPLEMDPSKKKQESKFFLSSGWIIFLSILVICLIVLVAVLTVILPKCKSEPITIPGTTTSPTSRGITPTTPGNIWDNPRLPEDIIPLHYSIDLTIDLDNFTFSGTSSMQIMCISKTNVILLHGNQLTINTERVRLELADDVVGMVPNVVDVRLYPENHFILVELEDTLEENVEYLLTVEFQGKLQDDLVGLYRSSYTTPLGDTRWIAATFFSPTNARRAFPCFDEPGLKANFTFSITHRQGYMALANMNEAGPPEPGPSDGWLTTRFLTTPKMSTYIICYTVMDFVYKETYTTSGVRIRAWSREEVIDGVTYGMDLHRDILQYYEQYFDFSFPLAKIDVVALSDFLPSAMENWGLITYKESSLLFVPDVTSTSTQQSICTVIAHELGHQYFGNLVTHAWWDYILLKEGFASYMEYTGVPHVEPDWNLETQALILDLHYVMEDDALASSRPVEVQVETSDEVSQLFDSIAYNKGASILRMCRSFLGEPTFQKGLKIYINRFAYQTATNDELWDCLQEAADEDGLDLDVATIMHTWVLQMGYPVVNITRDYTDNDVINFQADQKRFLQDPKANTSTHYDDLGYVWWVPLTFSSSSSPESDPLVWMENGPAEATVEGATSDWLLVNLDQTGFYRVNYDTQNWKLLSKQLVTNHSMIPEANRAALLNDAFNLARAGEMSQAIALDITLYLTNETQYVPWKAAISALGYLDNMLSKTGAYGALQKYMLQQGAPLYHLFGWTNEGTHLEKLTRRVALDNACKYGYPDCLEEASNLYRVWMNDASNNPIDGDFRSTVYCAAIAAGGQDEWMFAFDQYQTTTIAAEKSTLMRAMACANQPWILSTYLAYTLDSSKIRAQDAVDVVTFVASNPVGSSLAWDFFRANWDHFREEFGNSIFEFRGLIDGVTASFNTEFSLQQLLDFMEAHPDQGTGETALKQAVERTQANIRWMESYLEEVHQWLDDVVVMQ